MDFRFETLPHTKMCWFATDMLGPGHAIHAGPRPCVFWAGRLEARKFLSVNKGGGSSEVNGQNPLMGTKIFC